MSASDKKKLRKEQTNELLTQRQRQEQAEAKKLKTYTITFVAIMLVMVVAVLGILGVRAINNSGVIQKNTIAAVIGGKELNSVEFNYYYIDAINNYYNEAYNQYNTYTDTVLQQIAGLDPKKPLNKQEEPDTKKLWSQYFVDTALENAKEDFALYNQAMSEGFKLSEDEQKTLDSTLNNIEIYAQMSGYTDVDLYLRNSFGYGYGTELESYSEYLTRGTIADAFKAAHLEGLSYKDEQIREQDKKDPVKYNSYTYTSLQMYYQDFLEGGEKDKDGNVTYTDAERETARKAMKEAAEKLAKAKDAKDLEKIADEIKKDKFTVTKYTAQLYTSLDAPLNEWLADSDRKEGDIAALPITAEDNKDQVNAYRVAIFHDCIENKEAMSDVRHLLVKFEGGKKDETTGLTTYSDEEKSKAKTEAEGYLKTWKEGKADEESFIELVKKHSDDTSASEGGLFENIHPDSEYVDNFLNWSIDSKRKAGDAEIIETEYGYHVMYYVGDSDMTYRDYMISEELRHAEHTEWVEGLIKATKAQQSDISKLQLDLTISG